MPQVAGKDQNNVSTIIGLLNTDGVTIQPINADPSNHGLKINDNTTGTDQGSHIARDENFVPVAFVKSSAGDGALVPLYVDSSNMLLINSN